MLPLLALLGFGAAAAAAAAVASIGGPANLAEVTGAGNAGTQAPLFSTGLHVIAMQMLSGTDFRGYIDGVQAYAWNGVGTLINPLSRFIYGQKGINQQGYAFGSYWRAGALYSAITASVADICAAFAAEYL